MIKKKNIIYLTRDGLLEPLGQSQILSYLIPLSKFYNITIISFEKQNDLKLDGHLKFIKDICIKYSIDWHYFNYYQFSRTFGILLGFLKLFILTTYLCKQKKIDFIHSRSYYPAFVSLIIHKILNIPFIFDMRALWPEELVESKRISKNGYAWKIIKRLEKSCLKNSASVVSLTNAAVQHLHLTFPDFNLKSKTIVIPTCANLNKFKIKIDKKLTYQNKIKLSCIGSVLSGWFKLDFLRDSIQYILSNYPEVNFEFITRDDFDLIRNKIDPEDKWNDKIKFKTLTFEQMPDALSFHSGSLFFFKPNISKLGSAPTRMAELLGCGIPILTNSGVGDVAEILNKHKIGIVINDLKDLNSGCDSFIKMIKEESISKKCRSIAKELFSVNSGVKKYALIYENLG